VIEVSHLSDAQKRAYTLIDNTLALNATWDADLLKAELSDLALDDFDLSLLAMDNALLELGKDDGEGEDGDDDEEIKPKETGEGQPTTTQLGQIWKLGQHRLAVGSSEDPTLVGKLLEGYAPNLMVTDPPYGVKVGRNTVAQMLGRDSVPKHIKQKYKAQIKTYSNEQIKNDDRCDWKEAYALFPGNVVYCWYSSLKVVQVVTDFEDLDFEHRQQIIWNKSMMIFGRSAYHWKHEPCAYFVRKGASASWVGDRKQTTVWDMGSPKRGAEKKTGNEDDNCATEHPTQKPVEVYTIPIQNHTQIGDALYDPFAGSGTLFVAAERARRVGLGVELDPRWADAAISRWEGLTGQKAELLTTLTLSNP
jgi:DNA modification methylase